MNLPAHNGTALQWYGTAGDGGMGLWEYLSAGIGNGHTRRAYVRAAERFALWALERGLHFRELRAPHVAAYVEQSLRELSVPTVKQHLSALRTLLDSLVRRGLLAYNPAASVRAPRYSIERGKTPSLSEGEMKRLMDSIDGDKLIDIRDRAMLSVMVYSFARVGAVIGMKTEDYLQAEGRMWFRFREKNGKRHEVPAHSEASRTVEAWIAAAGSGGNRHQPLFRAVSHAGKAGPNAMDSNDVLRMVKRRAKFAGLSEDICCHSFRATGLTAYLRQGGSLERAQRLAAHSSPRTTKLYDHNNDPICAEEIERVRF